MLAELAEDSASPESGDDQASFPPPPTEIPPDLNGFMKKITTSTEQQNGSVGTTTTAVATASSSRTRLAPAMAPRKYRKMFQCVLRMVAVENVLLLDHTQFSALYQQGRPVLGEETRDYECIMKTSKELWNALEKKYKTKDVGLKKFVAAKFLDFKLVVVSMVINEAFEVPAFIEKLPPMLKDFKNYLKHKRKEKKLEDLIVSLRIGEETKVVEKKSRGNSTIMGTNIVEEATTSKRRKKSSGQKYYPSKEKFKGNCHNCGKVGRKAAHCRAPKKDKKKSKANMIEKNDDIDDLCSMLSKCNPVENPRE
ncbi:uncharacterized protein [Nicotiana tomentosiformis]|uniref:uncharacterized protein n=1 Tax=Nicotiana tomentosiformis TaxID=4098 RepID=UPI00388CC755